MNENMKDFIKRTLTHYIPSLKYNNSYSQAGEDVVMDFLLQQTGLCKPHYLELGASHPVGSNNTYKFYERGARGVLVEADKNLIPIIRKIRPEDTILNIGVGEYDAPEQDFYLFKSSALNTFSREAAQNIEKNGVHKIQAVIKLPVKTINSIIRENFAAYPDLLSIDIEGLDLPVLKTLDFTEYPIPVICAETCGYSENHRKVKNRDIEEFLRTKGYFVYADTYINTICVNHVWFDSAGKK
ncbi:MAG: FkbM family methyltransferase [Elusimicrobia bacterium]|nr:MAG: FkbM family methyltransferase [Elusimicrobiota bacterium]KAF0156999.1 MAG: FkbM family methyltransferase [Elusimicrobiota bacterium]